MKGDEILKRIDHGTGLTLDQLIDAFVSDPKEAKNLKDYIVEVAEAEHKEEE